MTQTTQTVQEVTIPMASGLRASLHRVDFADAYEVLLNDPSMQVSHAYWAVFGSEPVWVSWLMRLRGRIAVCFGLAHPFNMARISVGSVPLFEAGLRAGPCMVQSISDCELIVGDDDKHLNFRISTFKSQRDGQSFVTIATAVQIHNVLGRAYMLFVKPFHRFIAPFMVRRAVRLSKL